MNQCQCYPAGNDNNYHPINSNLNLVQKINFCYRPYGNPTTGAYHYEHTLFQTSPTISHNAQWGRTDYYQQDSNQNFYRGVTDNTPPPEEVLNNLLRQQNDKHLDSPDTNNMNAYTLLSPMSMRSSVDSFENNVDSPPPTTLNYVNDQPIADVAYYGQQFESNQQQYQQQQQEYYQYQYQLQHQYQLQQQQYFVNESVNESVITTPYDTMIIQQEQQQNTNTIQLNSSYQQKQVLPLQTTSRRTNVSLPNTTATNDTRQPLKRNTRKRTTPSQLQCATCFKIFSRPYNLKSHQKTHTKERPFVCLRPGCNWTFARPHDLKRHDLLHTGVKPYACGCGKRFARSDAFKRHQAIDPFCATIGIGVNH